MAPPPPHDAHTLQFLSNVLSQRGPTSLPYSEDVKWLIRQHLVSLTEAYPSLQSKTATFTHNDGRTVNLLQAEGTIPMSYAGVTYNIPVIIWLMEHYPRHPPCVFVNPTRDMIIKRPHQQVSRSGMVSVPYLLKWIYPSSNLVDLVCELSQYFGLDPPLYSQRKPDSNPINHSNNSNNTNVTSLNESNNSVISSNMRTGRVFPPSPYVGGDRSGRVMNARMEDPSEDFKKNVINKLLEMVHGDVMRLRETREAELEGLFSAQVTLRQREEELNKGLREMREEKEGLEQQLQLVLTNADVLEGWLRESEEKVVGKLGGNSVDVDDALKPCDVLSKQMIEASETDLAIEDAIYSLDKAIQDGVIPFDQYLRNVRLLSREQFFHKATAIKVRAAQTQADVVSMAARALQYTT